MVLFATKKKSTPPVMNDASKKSSMESSSKRRQRSSGVMDASSRRRPSMTGAMVRNKGTKPRRGSFLTPEEKSRFTRDHHSRRRGSSLSFMALPNLIEGSSRSSWNDETDSTISTDDIHNETYTMEEIRLIRRTAAALRQNKIQMPLKSALKKSSAPPVRDTPPVHTVALIVLLVGFFVQRLPSWDSLDEIATIETFTKVNFVSLPLGMVIAARLVFAAIMLGNATTVFLYGKWEADTDYFPGSKLRVAKRIPFRGLLHPEGTWFSGFQCLSTFTLWCWIVEGTAFFLAGMIPLVHLLLPNHSAPFFGQWVLLTALILWETAAPVSILVSAVVKYALWPMAKEHGENIKLLKAPAALLQHNLNSVAALVEVGLLGGLPVCASHFALPPLYGILYLLFSYSMMYSWVDQRLQPGAQFFYPFFDTTLGATTSLAILALLGILSLSFTVFYAFSTALSHVAEECFAAMVPASAIVLLILGVCRVRD